VQADQTQTVSVGQPLKLKVIGTVTSRAASSLVKPGTTADVYSINAVTQDKSSVAGGGGNLNSAWSAIATVPGVFVAPNQAGYIGAGPSLSIRGGDYDQIGYELDGVPLNRAFDQYPSGPLSSLGQQEVQVYTGAPAANAEANGISGYINQVIRTGTAPATRNLTLATGAPAYYGKVSFEAGGANPSRTFSYYLGAGAYNQDYRYYDNGNGQGLSQLWARRSHRARPPGSRRRRHRRASARPESTMRTPTRSLIRHTRANSSPSPGRRVRRRWGRSITAYSLRSKIVTRS